MTIGRTIGIVAIGRNEGERLKACLRSVVDKGTVVYVDSGSGDGSQAFARDLGVTVVELPNPPGFTAARARNAGAAALLAAHPEMDLIQFVDGDCAVAPCWLDEGSAALAVDPGLGLVFGRRRERHPEASIYNALIDDEWDVPVGTAGAAGGDVLVRREAYEAVGGYRDAMIAGEDPDFALRLRERGWTLRRIDAEMTLHDAAVTRFGQWWTRSRRTGHAYADLARRHPASRWPDWGASVRRILFWGGAVPGIALAGLLLALFVDRRWAALPLLVVAGWALNVGRIARRRRREGLNPRLAQASALFLMLGKLPEFLGVAAFHRDRRRGRGAGLIEYK